MGRPEYFGQAKLGTLRVVHDMIVVAGTAPAIWRVLGFKEGMATSFEVEQVPGEYFEGARPWPKDLFTQDMLIYKTGLVVTADLLTHVDLLHIWAGATQYGTRTEGYWLWQEVSGLGGLTLLQVRAALKSPWLERQRHGRPESARGITLRE